MRKPWFASELVESGTRSLKFLISVPSFLIRSSRSTSINRDFGHANVIYRRQVNVRVCELEPRYHAHLFSFPHTEKNILRKLKPRQPPKQRKWNQLLNWTTPSPFDIGLQSRTSLFAYSTVSSRVLAQKWSPTMANQHRINEIDKTNVPIFASTYAFAFGTTVSRQRGLGSKLCSTVTKLDPFWEYKTRLPACIATLSLTSIRLCSSVAILAGFCSSTTMESFTTYRTFKFMRWSWRRRHGGHTWHRN